MINEVAPPGFGHTKSGKGDKKGGTAAAFDRARKRGDFKGTKSQMFAIMWSQKNKGDKPHYKPGTDKKYKKYQDESFEIDKSAHKSAQKKAKLRNLAKGNENPYLFQNFHPDTSYTSYQYQVCNVVCHLSFS